MRYDSVYLSPHLDDVAISCAGRVLKERAAGVRVLVVSLFTAGASDEAVRKKEDRRAMRRLGVDFEWLDLPDAPRRRRFYRSFRAIVFGEHPLDRAFLAGRVVPAIRDRAAARIYAPLAVGTHIDHRLTFEAAKGLPGVVFYEDRPYVFLRENLRMRLSELGSSLPGRASPKTFLRSLDRTAYIRAYGGGACASAFLRRLRAAPSRSGPTLKPEVVRCRSKEFEAVRAVVGEYASQVGGLFGGDYAGSALEYAARLGATGYAERYWIPLDKSEPPEYM